MGSGRFDADDWKKYSRATNLNNKTREEIFASSLHPDLNPHGVKVRESRDSKDNPASTAIIIAQDVTGSMGMISEAMVKTGIPTLLDEIYKRKPVTDPHVLCAAIGDIDTDQAPLQITQFEADLRISKQLEKFYLEGNGGGNDHESYSLAWYFAAQHTSIDCFEKRGKKGYLFTIGDELPTGRLSANKIRHFLGDGPERDLTDDELLNMVSKQWEVFHILVMEGSFARWHKLEVVQAWNNLIGERSLKLSDHTKLAEVIVSAIQIREGADHDTVAGSWDGSTSLVVQHATKGITSYKTGSSGGVVSL